MMKFKANRSGYIKVLLLASLILPMVIFFLTKGRVLENPIIIILSLIPFGIFLWIYFGTYYIVENDKLFYKSAFLSGHLDISKIREITKGKTTWIGRKPATATKGLLIKYNAYDEIYISPESNDLLIEILMGINDKIKVIE